MGNPLGGLSLIPLPPPPPVPPGWGLPVGSRKRRGSGQSRAATAYKKRPVVTGRSAYKAVEALANVRFGRTARVPRGGKRKRATQETSHNTHKKRRTAENRRRRPTQRTRRR